MGKNHLSLYLDKYAETLSLKIVEQFSSQAQPFHHCLVIPAYRETVDFIERLDKPLERNGPILVIIILNQPTSDDDSTLNQQCWDHIVFDGKITKKHQRFFSATGKNNDITFIGVDCYSEGHRLPDNQGVGLARKLGCDIACHLIHKKIISTQWIHTTDADTHLPQNYFQQIDESIQSSAVHYAFQHFGPQSIITEATSLYEKALRYYVKSLEFAGSPYAFYTLGSCIAVDANHYAQARGFPKKSGGEDFYLLNKLAKIGGIKTLTDEPLLIDSRPSNRAPFGTGPAVNKIMAMQNPEQEFLYYHPRIFDELKHLLKEFKSLPNHADSFIDWQQSLSPATQKALNAINIEHLFAHLVKQAKTPEQYHYFIGEWFDAFKTLKFIHALRQNYADMPLLEAIDIYNDRLHV
jgi:hypothetical protein